jgi:hypothetical protein
MRISLAPQAGRNTKGDYVISMRVKESVARVVRLEERIALNEVVPEDED